MPKIKETELLVAPVAAEEEDDESTVLLEQAAALMAKAASDRKNRRDTLKEVEGLLAKLKITDFEDLAESPVVRAFVKAMGMGDLQPGQVKNKGTLAEREREWTPADMARFEQVTLVPAISGDYTWNGVGPYRLVAGEETTVPKPIYDRYREVLEARKQAGLNEAWMLGHSDRPPHPSWQTPEGAIVRAHSIGGRPYGVIGGTLATGRIHEATPGEEGKA